MNGPPAPPDEVPEAISGKRRTILDGAVERFPAQGYGAVSMDAVTGMARVSKATLYAHFRATDRLSTAIMEAGCAAMSSRAPRWA
ncbi:MAG: helix-turn-helix transcriptional regulator [Acetobacteraceae bacterium]|nr:helix-turn-helix transcriptional regulator [Acetobacteraceae bacterium]